MPVGSPGMVAFREGLRDELLQTHRQAEAAFELLAALVEAAASLQCGPIIAQAQETPMRQCVMHRLMPELIRDYNAQERAEILADLLQWTAASVARTVVIR